MRETGDYTDLTALPRAVDQWQDWLIKAEYEDLVASLRANEELGERRLASYLTLIAAVTAALGLASSRFEDDVALLIAVATVAAAILMAFGIMTLRRIMGRNVTTSAYLDGLRRIRSLVAQAQPELVEVLAFPPEPERPRRERPTRFGIGRAGLLETVAAINSTMFAIVAGGTVWLVATILSLAFAGGFVALAGAWAAQMEWTRHVYEDLNCHQLEERNKRIDAWRRWVQSR